MREMDLADHLQVVASSEADRGGCPFPHAVHREDRSLVEGRREERAGSVALVMLGEQQALLQVPALGPVVLQLSPEEILLKQLLPEPERDRHPKRAEPARRERDVGFEEPLELEEWLIVEGDLVDLIEPDPRFGETVVQGLVRKTRVVLLAAEPLF